jgi:pyruvate-formate lyase-activating enzyme
MHEARQYTRLENKTVKCSLCSHRCTIADGKHGICGVRWNRSGTLEAATYGKISAEAIDPIEKKPLFHYLPGTLSYSLGSIGCNFHCEHCQNWHISRSGIDSMRLQTLSPEEGVRRAIASGSRSISWTYNEPSIWHEYPLDMGTLARAKGLGTVYVTNGYITEEALRELSPMLSAYRVDIKAFTDEFYKKTCGAKLQPVLDSAVLAKELGMHIETVTLVIPGLNDGMEEQRMTFVHNFDRMHRLVKEPDNTVALYVGPENWPLPIPLVEYKGTWYFDADLGKQEVLYRRVGRNEMAAHDISRVLVDAEKEYYDVAHRFTDKFESSPNTRDGLYWKSGDPGTRSPIGPYLAQAGVTDSLQNRQPFHGYFYRILLETPVAPDGDATKSTRNKFAVVAFPAEYRSSGVKTFIMQENGDAYEKDLGPSTASVAIRITSANPDNSWTKVD